MAAPILWAPGILGLFPQETSAHKSPGFKGGGVGVYLGFLLGGGGGKCHFIFMGVGVRRSLSCCATGLGDKLLHSSRNARI